MNFNDALDAMYNYKKVRRTKWMKGTYLSSFSLQETGNVFTWEDLIAEDWEIAEEIKV